MACSCKHRQQEIATAKKTINDLKRLFIRRMTVDSEHSDRRKKDYNQAIFFYSKQKDEHVQCFNGTTMEMVLDAFNNAIKDYRDSYCDVDRCRRK